MSIHHDDTHPFAEEGEFCTAASTLPVLHYYPVRGRAEPIRLLLAYKGQKWFEPPVEPILEVMRQELDGYVFRQLPRFVDEVHGDVDIVQSQAIMRHLGRKYDMYGDNHIAYFRVDMIMEGVVDLRAKLKGLYVDDKLTDNKKAQYLDTVLAPELELTRKADYAGPGMACLEHWLAVKTDSKSGWFVTDSPTIADVAVFDLVDLHMLYFPDAMQQRFPKLAQHHANFAALPDVKKYLASTSRHKPVWGVDWQGYTGG